MTQPDSEQTQRIAVAGARPSVVHDRNLFERVLRAVREVAAIVALVLASILMVLLLAVIGAVSERLSDAGDLGPAPNPATSACPFGEGQCGG